MSTMPAVKVLKGTLLEKTFLSKLIIVLWICRGNLINGLPTDGSLIKEVEDLYAACPSDYSCPKFRHEDNLALPSVTCSCSRQCSQFGTCCVDSPYRYPVPPKLTQACRSVASFPRSGNYFMIDRCPSDVIESLVWDNPCIHEREDDLMRLVPVTSVFTGITYKNYFCFDCYEKANHFFYWNVRPQIASNNNNYSNEADYDRRFGAEAESSTSREVRFSYDSVRQTWLASSGIDSIAIPVDLKFEIPKEIEPLRVECDSGVISKCSDEYSNNNVSNKCHSYTAVIYIRKNDTIFKYKNAHCALCNFEDLNDMICKSHFLANTSGINGGGYSSEDKLRKDLGSAGPLANDSSGSDENLGYNNLRPADKKLSTNSEKNYFQFNVLIDKSSGDRYDSKCEGNSLWDPFSKRCRKVKCAPGYVMKGRKCSRP